MYRLVVIAVSALLASCYMPDRVAQSSFGSKGFTRVVISKETYQISYVGNWGARPEKIRERLQDYAHHLCKQSFTLENVEETVSVQEHDEQAGGPG
jgi:hypothetical protein